MQIHALQWDLAWQDKSANFAAVRRLIDAAAIEPGGLIVLPEMFATGYTMSVDAAAEGEGDGAGAAGDTGGQPAEAFLAELAGDTGCGVIGGVVRRAPATGRGLNQALAVAPDGGELARYTKMHPMSVSGEADAYAPGTAEAVFEFGGLRIAPLVCYDLRFPERFRASLARDEAGGVVPERCPHLFVVIANWPSKRVDHWHALLTARAIENQACVLGVNRTGADPNLAYPGGSVLVDAWGQTLARADEKPGILTGAVDPDAIARARTGFPALADARADPRSPQM